MTMKTKVKLTLITLADAQANTASDSNTVLYGIRMSYHAVQQYDDIKIRRSSRKEEKCRLKIEARVLLIEDCKDHNYLLRPRES